MNYTPIIPSLRGRRVDPRNHAAALVALPKIDLKAAEEPPPRCGACTDEEGHGRGNEDVCSHVLGVRRYERKLVLGGLSREVQPPKFVHLAANQFPQKLALFRISLSEQNFAETLDVSSCGPGVHRAPRFLVPRSKRRSSGCLSRSSFNPTLQRRSPPGEVKRIYITNDTPPPVLTEV